MMSATRIRLDNADSEVFDGACRHASWKRFMIKRAQSLNQPQTPRFWIGTSGYQYPEWRGTFYPEKLSTAKMLAFYAERFATTEINYSFRQIPSEKTLMGWSEGTPARFRFSLKAPQKVTHIAKLRDCEETVRFFAKRVSILGPKLGAILFQLPPFLKADVPLLRDFLVTLPPHMRSAFEFRHASWFTEDVFAALKQHKAALCIADTEELSTPVVATAPSVYFRLRREDYTSQDLSRWVDQVEECSRNVSDAFIYFKHEETGVGPKFAASFSQRLNAASPR
jgi:uncharacterized protein YecE (DUF72 family)